MDSVFWQGWACTCPGINSGLISVSRMSMRISEVSGENCSERGHPADEMLDEGFGYAGVYVVVGHVVADAVGAPAEGQFTQVARADDEGVSQIGDAEQMRRPLSGLDIFKGDVVDRFPLGIGMADILEHLHAARPDVDFVRFDAQRLHQAQGIAVGFLGCGKTGHRVGQDVGAGEAQEIHGPGGDDQGMGGVEAARNADDDLVDPRGLQALRQTLNLDVVGLVAALVPFGGIRRDVGKTGDIPGRGGVALRWVQSPKSPAGTSGGLPDGSAHSGRSWSGASGPGQDGRDRYRPG